MMMGAGHARSAGDVVASQPRDRLVDALLENLPLGLASRRDEPVRVSLLRRFEDGYEQRIAMWPRATRPTNAEVDAHTDFDVPDFGVLRLFAASPKSTRQMRLVQETIAWLGAIMHAAPPRRRLEKTRHDALRARADNEVFEVRIARARESERIRLVKTMTTATVHDLDAVRTMLAEPGPDVPWSSVSTAMTSLIDDFRTTVRGVFPAMLPERGAAETLHEIAASLPVNVEFRGDLGRRPRWELESGFTQAVAGVLGAIASESQSVQVVFERDGALRARVKSSPVSDIGRFTRAIDADRERVDALGGVLTIRSSHVASTEISVAIPDRSGANWLPLSRGQLTSRPVHMRVAAILESARLPEEDIAPWRTQLFSPVRLLVLQQPLPAPLPGVQPVMCQDDPDRTLAEQLRDHDGPWGRIDAVVCAGAPDEEFVQTLRRGPLLFSPGTNATAAVSMLTARAPVLTARRALDAISEYVRRQPQEELLRWQVDHLTAGSHELVEDVLLDEVARGTAPAVIDDEGARLIGKHGGDKRVRLGLPESATAASIEDATDARFKRWTSIASRPGLDRSSREAAEVVLSSTTRLLMA